MFDNGLSGPVPESLGGLAHLRELSLRDNQLTGELPASLGNLTALEQLWLRGNTGLSGALPLSLVNLTNLRTLDLRDTGLCAPRDSSFQEWLDGVDSQRGVFTCPAS
ncbi:MAG: leucine-rich repeat domain-containing protein [Gemmatimonadetes bacterium]|nr:leucine-rich repeat domain-containing protein [Gemmatimonadota bacterium]